MSRLELLRSDQDPSVKVQSDRSDRLLQKPENHGVGSSILPLGIDGVSDFGDGDVMLRLNELLLQPIERRAGRL